MTDRKRARALAAEALAAGDPLGWFERLYREADTDRAVVPWADLHPNPHLLSWLESSAHVCRGRALDVGCGFGDDAEELARRGFDVTAFDISDTAIARARSRFPSSRVTYATANLLDPPQSWLGTFDFILEAYTLQVLPPDPRAAAARILPQLLAPGATLLVVARGRDPDDDAGSMPWPLTLTEIQSIAAPPISLVSFEDFMDSEDPPVRRFRAVFSNGLRTPPTLR